MTLETIGQAVQKIVKESKSKSKLIDRSQKEIELRPWMKNKMTKNILAVYSKAHTILTFTLNLIPHQSGSQITIFFKLSEISSSFTIIRLK